MSNRAPFLKCYICIGENKAGLDNRGFTQSNKHLHNHAYIPDQRSIRLGAYDGSPSQTNAHCLKPERLYGLFPSRICLLNILLRYPI